MIWFKDIMSDETTTSAKFENIPDFRCPICNCPMNIANIDRTLQSIHEIGKLNPVNHRLKTIVFFDCKFDRTKIKLEIIGDLPKKFYQDEFERVEPDVDMQKM